MSAKVTHFSGWDMRTFARVDVLASVNEFLAENSYEVGDVHVQFVTTRVQTGQLQEFGGIQTTMGAALLE